MSTFLTNLKSEFSLHSGPWDPSHRLETSWCLSPYALFAVRAVSATCIFATHFFIIAYECTHDGDYDGDGDTDFKGCAGAADNFSYFTHLTYWGLAFYMAFAAVHTFTYARYGTPLLDRFPRILRAAHALLLSSIVTYPFIVTIVYWAILYDPAKGWYTLTYWAWSNVSQHALNSVFALFEISMTRVDPLPWAHLPYLIIVLALYLGLCYVTKATKGFFPYSFLDAESNNRGQAGVAMYVLGILVACIFMYLLAKGLILLRKHVTERVLGFQGKFAHQVKHPEMDMESK